MSVPGAAERGIHPLAEGLDFGSVLYEDFHAGDDQLARGLDLLVGSIHALLSGVHAAIEASFSLLAPLSRPFQNGPNLIELAPDFPLHSSEL
jgi:hypothetical protein